MHHARIFAALALIFTACADAPTDEVAPTTDVDPSDVRKVEAGKADTSAEAVILDLAFSGSLFTTSSWNPENTIEDQLLYTVGHLNGDDAVGRLDKVVLTNVTKEDVEGGVVVKYDASLQVAWRKSRGVPATYDFQLPRDMSYQGKQAFTEAYSHDCVDYGAHDVTSGSMWYYFRPSRSSCNLKPEDIVETTAAVTVSDVNTTGKYPEYDMVWEDNVLVVVAVFGKYEDGATTTSDAGIRAWNDFNAAIRNTLGADLDVVPADAPTRPGVDVDDIMFSAKIDAVHRVVVHALLVDNVRTAGATFDARYGELSKNADLIIYNGHAGLGANIRALARKGDWQPGQYAMVFLNGCDTYAYVDSAIFDAHAAVNDDDDVGTRYADVITNALPAFFSNMSGATMSLIKGLMAHEAPKTYEQIFQGVDRSQIVLVSGEQDNVYVPGGGEEPTSAGWDGMQTSGALAKNEASAFETDVLPAGTYSFTMSGTGDADLYIRTGLAPTTSDYDCRPYRAGSNEACKVVLPAPARIHGMVRGYSAESTFDLAGAQESE